MSLYTDCYVWVQKLSSVEEVPNTPREFQLSYRMRRGKYNDRYMRKCLASQNGRALSKADLLRLSLLLYVNFKKKEIHLKQGQMMINEVLNREEVFLGGGARYLGIIFKFLNLCLYFNFNI